MSDEIRARAKNDEALEAEDNSSDDDDDDRRGGYRGGGRRGGGGRFRRGGRGCPFLVKGKCVIDYKNVDNLRQYVTETGKIRPRRQTGACSKCQRELARAIKRARHIALLPYAPEHVRRSHS